jgi:hypothetical protein
MKAGPSDKYCDQLISLQDILMPSAITVAFGMDFGKAASS